MNRHPAPLAAKLASGGILIILAAAVSVGRAQTTQPGISEALKTAASPDIPAITTAINTFMAAQMQALTSTDPAVRRAAKEALVDGAAARQGNPSARYLDIYSQQLNQQIAPVLAHQDEFVRLNAAIVVAMVAERADNINLRDAVLILLKDKSPNVAIWSLKAARAVVLPVIRNPGFKGDELLGGVVDTVRAHGGGPLGGPITIDGYDVMILDVRNTDPRRRPTDKMITTVIPYIHQILQDRVAAYRSGIPPEPLAERGPSSFLTHVKVWGLHTPQQKVTSMQLMSDLIGLASQHFAAAAGINREKLALIIGYVASAISVTPEVDGTATIKDQLLPAVKVTVNTAPADMAAAVAPVHLALVKHKSFEKLNPPPAVAAGGAGAGGDVELVETTQPTTASTTAPATTQSRVAATQPKPAAAPLR